MDRIVQGRRIGPAELSEIRALLSAHPEWGRSRLSVALCELWNWRDGTGRLKGIAARSLLRKLSEADLIRLPARRFAGRGSRRRSASERVGLDVDWPVSEAYSGPLSALQPVSVSVAEGSDRQLLYAVLERFHHLGLSTPVGESIGHLVRDRRGRIVGCSLTGAAALCCESWDRWIGWSYAERRAGLWLVANQQRFLILDAVRVSHLASHVLSLVSRRLSGDYEARYGHPVHLLESFVDSSSFFGNLLPGGGLERRGADDGAEPERAPGVVGSAQAGVLCGGCGKTPRRLDRRLTARIPGRGGDAQGQLVAAGFGPIAT